MVINYDGSSPSGFKKSNYTGMTSDCSIFKKKIAATKATPTGASLVELNSN